MSAIYKYVITWTGGAQLFQNVLHFNLEEDGGARPDEYAAALIAAAEGSFIAAWVDCLSTTVEAKSAMSQRITGDGGPSVTKLYSVGEAAGTRDGSIGNTSENVCLEFPVHLNSKNVTGKIFVSGILDDDIVDNNFDSDVITRVEALGTSLLGSISLGGALGPATYVIYNRATGFFATPTFRQIGKRIGSQRRRLYA